MERVRHWLNSEAPLKINGEACTLNNLYKPKIKSKTLFLLFTDRWVLVSPETCRHSSEGGWTSRDTAARKTGWWTFIFHRGVYLDGFDLICMDLERRVQMWSGTKFIYPPLKLGWIMRMDMVDFGCICQNLTASVLRFAFKVGWGWGGSVGGTVIHI